MAKLRVIAGKARGRRLLSVPGDRTRPVTDRTKESLFNIIGSEIEGATFLDLFAGTGSVGIEALSRGAKFVRFIEKNIQAVKTIKSNLEITDLARQDDVICAEVIHHDVFSYLKRQSDRSFDYIYIAPPQYKGLWEKTIDLLLLNPAWMNDFTWVIVQIHPVEYKDLSYKGLTMFDKRKYGSTLLLIYESSESPDMR